MSPPIINRRSVVQENSNDSVVKNNNRADKRIRRNRNHPNMLLSMCKSLQSYDMDGNIIRVKKGKDCYKKMMVTNNSKMLNRKINGLNEQVGKRNNSKHNPYKKRVSLKREENVKESVQMELVKKDEFDGVWIGEVLKKKVRMRYEFGIKMSMESVLLIPLKTSKLIWSGLRRMKSISWRVLK